MQIDKRYSFKDSEKRIYQLWEKGNFFKPNYHNKKGKFCIIMPPPNANASLHIGHAVGITIEDIMIRYNRMKQKTTLWVPGADHAGFETQVVFEKQLEKQGKNRFQFSNEALYEMMWDFTQKNREIMEEQIKCLGASCDWSRKKFTLDQDVIKEVYQTFKTLFNEGLIYRGKRIISWCRKHQTSFSDLEIVHQEQKTKLVYIKYPIKNSSKFITVATTRPETMLGDTAVVVNPKDKRYKDLLKQKVEICLPLTKRTIPLIGDDLIDPSFGTGAVKVTPAHNPVDFEIGQRHNLEAIQIIDKKGMMTEEAGSDYFGLKTNEARQKIVEDLKEMNLIEKEEDYFHSVPTCYKCKTAVEPLISDQWFIKIKPLADKAVEAVKKEKVKFVSKRFEKIFFNWMKNIRDWNISRQIVWGIKIPAYYCQERLNRKCQDKDGIIISEEKIKQCPYCKSKQMKEEKDTFDTWFSSGQWPFIALGYPKSRDYKSFYPTSVMETGWDILFFWVARMLMLGIHKIKKVPFNYVYLHGLVRDKDRQKMSKSKGNVIDPLGVIDIYGADALRMALIFGSDNQNDIVIAEENIIAQQRFVTKIWNASRFVLGQIEDSKIKFQKINLNLAGLTSADKKILKDLDKTIKSATKNLDNFKFHQTAQEVYHFFWHNFCDKYIEKVKSQKSKVKSTGQNSKIQIEYQQSQKVLLYVLVSSLKLLHPFIPFVTEEIYQKLPLKNKAKALIIEKWPCVE